MWFISESYKPAKNEREKNKDNMFMMGYYKNNVITAHSQNGTTKEYLDVLILFNQRPFSRTS